MFPKDKVKEVIGSDVAISNTMIQKIDEWGNMLRGNAQWVDRDAIYSLGIESGIVKEFANVSLNEMESSVTGDKLSDIYKAAIRDINENLQSGLAFGSMIIKPLGEDKVQYVTAENFIPVEFDSRGRLIKVVFIDMKQMSDTEYYTRFEYHALDENGLSISNKAYRSNSKNDLGKEVPLAIVQEWSDLEAYINYPLMTKPDFGYYRNPIKNEIDGSPCGVSVYDSAKYLIKRVDTQFGRLEWEFESGERAIHVDETALKHDNGKTSVEKLNKRLYRGVNISTKDNELFQEFSPEFRDAAIVNGLEEYKRAIEFSVGLSYGDISNPTTIDKTATEVKASKKRKYNTVTAIQDNLKDCLSDLVDALAFHNGLLTTSYEFVCTFKDSILVDEETERTQDRQDVSMGAMLLEEYRAKWYGETEEVAATKIVKEQMPVQE